MRASISILYFCFAHQWSKSFLKKKEVAHIHLWSRHYLAFYLAVNSWSLNQNTNHLSLSLKIVGIQTMKATIPTNQVVTKKVFSFKISDADRIRNLRRKVVHIFISQCEHYNMLKWYSECICWPSFAKGIYDSKI